MSRTVNLVRDGTNQLERLPEALRPGYVLLEERSEAELLAVVHQLATQFAYYNRQNQVDGDWQPFYPSAEEASELVDSLGQQTDTEPHLALMTVFMKLLSYAQSSLNELTQKHLEYFYKEVLGISLRPPVADKVHVFFKLSKNSDSYELKANTTLDAGKDDKGNAVVFNTNRGIVLNRTKIGSLKSLFFDHLNNARIYAAPVANSADGRGAKFDKGESEWSLFGPDPAFSAQRSSDQLENTVGLALSSPMFLLSEGSRIVIIDLIFIAEAGRPSPAIITDKLQTAFSGEESWIDPDTFSAEIIYEFKESRAVPPDPPLQFPTTPDVVDGVEELVNPESYTSEGNVVKSVTTIETVSSGGTTRVTSATVNEIFVPKIRIKSSFKKSQPAITPFNSEVLGGGFKTSWPIWKLSVKSGQDDSVYSYLRKIKMRKVTLSTEVEGLTSLSVHNDVSRLDTSKSFLPFGAFPGLGASVYIGSEELARKNIDSLGVEIHWDQLPESKLENHYYAYDRAAAEAYAGAVATPPTDGTTPEETALGALRSDDSGGERFPNGFNSIFEVSARLRHEREWLNIRLEDQRTFPLFEDEALQKDENGNPIKHTIQFDENMIARSLEGINFKRDTSDKKFDDLPNQASQGFISLTLEGPAEPLSAFGHRDYARVNTEAAIYNANPANEGEKPLPNPPYTPSIKALSLNYTASQEIELIQDYQGEQLFHLEPFGHYQLKKGNTPMVFPDLKNEGNLYIGLLELDPPQTVSFLFQLVDGNATPGQSLSSETIQWSYLEEDSWVSINRDDVLVDTTKGFQRSGIIELLIGSGATSDNQRLPSGMHWLRASVSEGAASANFALNIHTQAVTATRQLQTTAETVKREEELELLLPPGRIKKLRNKAAAINKVSQPYASFGGKHPEPELTFYNRVSERLRHKQRAVTYWDFERIVLEAFPSIFKVKCLPHSLGEDAARPGTVTMVIISNLRQKNSPNPFQPKSSTITLTEVREFLYRHTSPFVEIKVENPVYEPMLLDFKVGFKTGFDPGFYGKQLNDEIKRYLSPWAFTDGKDIVLGGRINRADILTFVESREYVDYVNDFDLYHLYEGDNPLPGIGEVCIGVDFVVRGFFGIGVGDMSLGESFVVGEPVEEAVASTPKSVLVTADEHRITIIESEGLACSAAVVALGIGFMRVGADFIVGSYDFAIGDTEIVPPSIGGNPALSTEAVLPGQYKVYDISELKNNP